MKLNESRIRDRARWFIEFPEWAVAAVERERDGCGSPDHEVGVVRVPARLLWLGYAFYAPTSTYLRPEFVWSKLHSRCAMRLGVKSIFCTAQTW